MLFLIVLPLPPRRDAVRFLVDSDEVREVIEAATLGNNRQFLIGELQYFLMRLFQTHPHDVFLGRHARDDVHLAAQLRGTDAQLCCNTLDVGIARSELPLEDFLELSYKRG